MTFLLLAITGTRITAEQYRCEGYVQNPPPPPFQAFLHKILLIKFAICIPFLFRCGHPNL